MNVCVFAESNSTYRPRDGTSTSTTAQRSERGVFRELCRLVVAINTALPCGLVEYLKTLLLFFFAPPAKFQACRPRSALARNGIREHI